MKICITTDAWHPQINGVVTTLSQTAGTLLTWGHEVLVINPSAFSSFPCPTYPEIRLSLVRPDRIRRMIEDFSPNAVHVATEGPLGWAARSVCRKAGIRFTTSYHTRFPEYVRMRFPVPLKISYPLVRAFHQAAKSTMVAPTIIEELKRKLFANLVPWSRGVDVELFHPGRKDLLPGKRPHFVYAGRVAVEKNLKAFLDLRLPGSKYVIGDGPALADMRRAYPEVTFTGAKRGEDLARHMASADVFVFPSLTDTFGVVLLESMACGVPVAAYPVTGPDYLITEGVNGALDKDLRAAALRALDISPEGCLTFARSFTWEACTRQFMNNLAIPA
jgi:1,2-diacylglycerol 3-alpha-glucosyltransferase/glucuronosyltransferase